MTKTTEKHNKNSFGKLYIAINYSEIFNKKNDKTKMGENFKLLWYRG